MSLSFNSLETRNELELIRKNCVRVDYNHPLSGRYASNLMKFIWSEQNKFSTWRKLWTILAIVEKEFGLDQITDEQINEMKEHLYLTEKDFQNAKDYEDKFKHDVMAHVHAFGDVCPKAAPIIHLGVTSCFVGDNTDIIILNESINNLITRSLDLISGLMYSAKEYKKLPCLGYTHLQPAQLVTVGKRISLWLHDFMFGFLQLKDIQLTYIKLRGIKGTTGTQASFLELFNGNSKKVNELDKLFCEKIGIEKMPVTGQTYSRILDSMILNCLSLMAQALCKMAEDIRILASFKEIEEPFSKDQIGSSAMPYKRNPMKCERICSLARYIISLPFNTAQTASNQWMERTLDDSANRRMCLSEAFLTMDALINLSYTVISGLVINEKIIEKRINEELPFMATENIMMAAVKEGGNRQELHEAIRKHSIKAGKRVKQKGLNNDLLKRIRNDPLFEKVKDKLTDDELLDPKKYIGRCPEQVDAYIIEIQDMMIF